MDFSTIARNHLALNGDFNNFDFSLFTNLGVHHCDLTDFCFYNSGFHGVPELGLRPSEQYAEAVQFLLGRGSLDKSAITALGLKKSDFGMLARMNYSTAIKNRVADLLYKFFMNPQEKPMLIQTGENQTKAITLFEFILITYAQTNKLVTVDQLVDYDIVDYVKIERTTQAFLIGSTIHSALPEQDFNEILRDTYAFILKICSSDLLKFVAHYPTFALNFEIGKASKKLVESMTYQTVRAAALGETLDSMMHKFGLSIPDAYYSVQHFGTIVINNDNQYYWLQQDGTIGSSPVLDSLTNSPSKIDLNVDINKFNEQWGSTQNAAPRRISLD